ncbi:helix-turn-helix transcriptional regulator [Winogradskyella aquimaris]|uniref:AraC family transcriptional regulator n=1 Tax=Winogradskyella aquimaris TaxID=864074 RepID=A0ABU5ENT0_9FLAO|nr:AraC family transcriptional regulator [Winogradskyella aquimaris]MDY2588114.1 AraC family transcriptional regulator [Winogradskyella aquimaris]
MKITLDIGRDLKEQFRRVVNSDNFEKDSGYSYDKIKLIKFPDHTEFYHFEPIEHNTPVYMTSTNSKNSEWYLIHMNIGADMQLKKTTNQPMVNHRFVPAGILLYCPGIEIKTNFPMGHRSELASIRIPKHFLDNYYESPFIKDGQLLVYEDMEYGIENKIRAAIKAMNNKLKCHVLILEVIEHLFNKIKYNSSKSNVIALHNEDINNLLVASELLKNHLSRNIPSIKELAMIAKMSPSKFKVSFKQFFGRAPHQYHFKIKMEYARNELRMGNKTPVELSYELDYSHPSNFSSAYKNYFNTLPSLDFRKV